MMSQLPEPSARSLPLIGEVRVGPRVAQVLTLELSRHAGPKTGLVIGVEPDSAVLQSVVDELLPGDQITLVPAAGTSPAQLRTAVVEHGPWAEQKLTVVDSLGEADP